MRLAGLLALSGACAHVEPPSGGPQDLSPPFLVRVQPESLSVVPGFKGPVRFEFDEGISERNVERSVLLAPAPGGVKIKKGKRSVSAEPRRGWEDGRVYHAVLLPVMRDLFGNQVKKPVRLVFSTGPEVPSNRVAGRVTDRITGRAVRDARIEARWLDGEVAYPSITDSVGAFELARLPAGQYRVIAFEDRNLNLAVDPLERADSTAVSMGIADSLTLRLRLLERDTTPPVAGLAAVIDSVTVALDFDDYLDPEQPADSIFASLFEVPAGPEVPVMRVLHGFEYDRQRVAAGPAPRDTAARDTAPRVPRAPQDTVREVVPRRRPGIAPRRPAPGAREAPAPAPQAREERAEPLPQRRVYLRLRAPLAAGSYRAEVSGARNVAGLIGGGAVAFEVKRPPPPPPPPPPPEKREP
ncbi:MAG: carboxypeptidase regulatory-like domain-containing protein [Gemmatimonadetes bacterium]|nr:carboxypeptidase regulatory-like domain-containing protein [Gemmatimonadota bacterium]